MKQCLLLVVLILSAAACRTTDHKDANSSTVKGDVPEGGKCYEHEDCQYPLRCGRWAGGSGVCYMPGPPPVHCDEIPSPGECNSYWPFCYWHEQFNRCRAV